MMPDETKQAVEWALAQLQLNEEIVTHHNLVHKVRDFFNTNEVEYDEFSYQDLVPYLPQ